MTIRLQAIREQFDVWGVDGIFIHSAVNRRWTSGFTGSAGYLWFTRTEAWIATDGRYWNQAVEQCPEFQLHKIENHSVAGLLPALADSGATRIGLEASHATLSFFGQLETDLFEWIPLETTIEPLRNIKSAEEIAKIQAAAEITDAVMAQVNEIAHVGMTEKQLAWELEKRMRELGADGLAFETIVASGIHGARPHHRPSDKPLAIGDIITIDMGAKLDGYHSDLTRTFHMGTDPDPKFWEIYNLVLLAQETAIQQMKAGMRSDEIDGLCRSVIADAGYGDAFKHSTGHGVGLEIHESARVSYLSEMVLHDQTVITIEPGIYLDGWSGMRIEDLMLLTAEGSIYLSHCPKNPIIECSKA